MCGEVLKADYSNDDENRRAKQPAKGLLQTAEALNVASLACRFFVHLPANNAQTRTLPKFG
jgi:hypothetical protein